MNDRIQGFIAGAVTCSAVVGVFYYLYGFPPLKTKKAIEVPAADDSCHSLYYDILPEEDTSGVGFPSLNSASLDVVARMKVVHPEYARLPFALYKQIVENLPVVCVDVICRRQDGKLLLFYRRDKPAAHIWWWPGGRMSKGETFYDAAVRKIRDETGQQRAVVKPVGVVTVWNTFFPDSHWDAERKPGREGTQTVNVVVMCDIVWSDAESDANNNANSKGTAKSSSNSIANADWAVEAHRWVTPAEAITPGAYDKYVSGNVKLAIDRGLLTVM